MCSVEVVSRQVLLEILPQQAGMHLTVRLTGKLAGRVTDVEIAERARQHALVLVPLSGQYAGERREQGFFLGYAGWSEADLELAVDALVDLLRDAARR